MSIAAFMAKAQETSTSKELTLAPGDVSTGDFTEALEMLDNTSTSKSITDEQFLSLKILINQYREQIKMGTFVETEEALHAITIWYRVSREVAFIAIKEKKPKAPAKGRAKKAVVLIGELM